MITFNIYILVHNICQGANLPRCCLYYTSRGKIIIEFSLLTSTNAWTIKAARTVGQAMLGSLINVSIE